MLLLGFAYRTLRLRDLPKVLVEAVVTTGSIMLIVASANLLGYIFARERVPQEISESMLGLTTNADRLPAAGLRCCRWCSARRWTPSRC